MRPSRIITAVENELRTSFCAVPALSRVDPVSASGPVRTASRMSARTASSASGLAVTRAVTAPQLPSPRESAGRRTAYDPRP